RGSSFAEFLLRCGIRVGLDYQIRRYRTAAIDHATTVRLENGACPSRGIALERVRVHLNKNAFVVDLALLLNRAAVRRIPLGGGHLQSITVVELEDLLYQPLAERCRSNNDGSVVILERPSKDFRRRRRRLVGENYEWQRGRHRDLTSVIRLRIDITAAHAGDLRA